MADYSGSKTYENMRLADYTDESEAGVGQMDIPFLLITLLLLGIGVVMVLSASFARAYYDPSNETGGRATYYFARQVVFAIGGVGVMLIASRFPMSLYRRLSMPMLVVSLGLLAIVPLIGAESGGARRWIDLGFTTFQPSEVVKVAVILSFSFMICKYKDKMKTFRYGIMPFAGILILIAGLLILEPHYSATIIVFVVGAAMMFIGGVRLAWFIGGIAALGGAGFVIITTVGYTSDRISAWLDPLADSSGKGFQILQSLYAIGSGGLMGLGLGQSRQKYLYLPEEHNDFIFAVVCEELGFIGAMLILALFALLVVRGYWLALHSRDRFNFLVCTGLTTLIAVQVILNVAVVTNLVPCTGISLPFFSYGGTALLLQLAEMGIILSISREIPAKKAG